MNDVFISYSRRNKEFTQKLYNALIGANRNVWADWDSIPAASDWFAEIKQGIEETNSVLFVLSPEWVKSTECRKEFEYALAMGKRLFPIVYATVDPNDVPPELAKINWVYMRDTDDFDKGFQTLCSAMDTDLDWIKTHTRIQIRALEWDKKNRDNSFTLRGNDLVDGERFLANSSGKNPDATALQGEYIFASRKDATRRQRVTLAGVTVALIVSIALGIVALFARQAAVFAQNEAEQERNHAVEAEGVAKTERDRAVAAEEETKKALALSESARLAAQAQVVLGDELGDPETAMLLSLKSLQTQYHAQADKALTDSIQKFNLISTYPVSRFIDNNIWGVFALSPLITLSPDGKVLAAASNDEYRKKITLYNTENKEVIQEFKLIANIYGLQFTPDGKYLAIGEDTGEAELIDISDGKSVMSYKNHTDRITCLAVSNDGKHLITGSTDMSAVIWDIETGEPIKKLFHTQPVISVTFSPDGRFAYTTDQNRMAYKWDALSGSMIGSIYTYNYIFDITASPDGKKFATATEGKIEIWDASNYHLLKTLFQPEFVYAVKFSPDGKYLVTGGADHTARLWDIESGKAVKSFVGHTDDITSIVYSPDGSYIYTGSVDGMAHKWNAIVGSNPWVLRGHISRVSDVAFSPDGKTLITGSWDEDLKNVFKVWNLNTGSIKTSLVGHLWVSSSISFSADGKYVLTSSGDSTVKIWDAENYKVLQTIEAAEEGKWVNQAVFSQDGKYIFVATDADATYWDWKAKEKLATFEGISISTRDVTSTRSVALSPDGNLAAVGLWNGNVIIYNIKDHTERGFITGYDYPKESDYNNVESLQFTSDSKYILFSSINGNVALYDIEAKKEVQVFEHDQKIYAAAISPNGKYVATGGSDRIVRIWDVETGKLAQTLIGHTDAIYGLAFSADGKFLASGSADSTARIWFVNYDDKLNFACSLITRQLSPTEMETYFVTDDTPVCEQQK